MRCLLKVPGNVHADKLYSLEPFVRMIPSTLRSDFKVRRRKGNPTSQALASTSAQSEMALAGRERHTRSKGAFGALQSISSSGCASSVSVICRRYSPRLTHTAILATRPRRPSGLCTRAMSANNAAARAAPANAGGGGGGAEEESPLRRYWGMAQVSTALCSTLFCAGTRWSWPRVAVRTVV